MKIIPQTTNMPVLRTDFSDDAMWQTVCDAMAKSYHEFALEIGEEDFDVTLAFISDPEYSGITPEQVLALIPLYAKRTFIVLSESFGHSCIFIVDHTTIIKPEHPVLAMNLEADEGVYTKRGYTFRLLPSEVAAMEINLTVLNMGFRDFSKSVDEDGIFRGFQH